MNTLQDNKIVCIPVYQNQQEFLISVFRIHQILKFTRYTSRLIVGFDDDNNPIYNKQIQREVENGRVEKIADFLINDPEATFPTNIVLHIPIQVIERQERIKDFIEIYLTDKVFSEIQKEVAKSDVYVSIIDGQHRTRGIEVAISRLESQITLIAKTLQGTKPPDKELQKKLDYYAQRLKDLLNIQLVVSFFIDKSLEYQAMIFSTINRTQKRVSESLVYSLFGLETTDTPQKTALQIVIALNSKPISPFYGRIKLYGGSYDRNQSPPLSQATMVKSIVTLISENWREAENDRHRSRKELSKRSLSSQKILPFRIYYATNKDTKISDIFFSFFTAVKVVFSKEDGTSYWDFDPDSMSPSNILQTTVGYQALLNILVDVLQELSKSDKFSQDTYLKYLVKVKNLNFEDVKRYPFTSKSRSILYLDMSLKIWPPLDSTDKRILKLNELLNETS